MGSIYIGDVLGRITVPDTQFEAVQIADAAKIESVYLIVRCREQDNFNPDAMFEVCRAREVPAYYNSELEAFERVKSLMYYIACHNVDEVMKFDGKAIDNPHDTFKLAELP